MPQDGATLHDTLPAPQSETSSTELKNSFSAKLSDHWKNGNRGNVMRV